jgi:hypothetical protein
MAAEQIELKRAELIPRNGRFRERAESGVDAVNRNIPGRLTVDDDTRGRDAFCSRGRDSDVEALAGNLLELFERQ